MCDFRSDRPSTRCWKDWRDRNNSSKVVFHRQDAFSVQNEVTFRFAHSANERRCGSLLWKEPIMKLDYNKWYLLDPLGIRAKHVGFGAFDVDLRDEWK